MVELYTENGLFSPKQMFSSSPKRVQVRDRCPKCPDVRLPEYGPVYKDHRDLCNILNLDPLTETYGLPFYMQYLAHWPEYFQVAESPSGEIMGYIMGKAEGGGEVWHGHVTALTVASECRRLGLAAKFMKNLEEISEQKRCYFVDLFVRVSNKVAVEMYNNLGYSVYRRVIEYYSGDVDEDAYDMRKALSRDVDKKSIEPYTHPVHPEELE